MKRHFLGWIILVALVAGCGRLAGEGAIDVPLVPSPETKNLIATVPVGVTPPDFEAPTAAAPSPTEEPLETYDPFAVERPLSLTGYTMPPTVQHVTETTAQILFQLETPQPGAFFYRSTGKGAPGPVQSLALDPSYERHFLTLEGLTGGSTYEFLVRLGDGEAETLQDVPFMDGRWGQQTFRTPPYDSPLRFAVIGDSGFGEPVTYALAQQIADFDPHFVLHVGDVVYQAGKNASPYEAYQLKYYAPFSRVLQQVPIYPAPGNHDIVEVLEPGMMLFDRPVYYWVFPPISDPAFPPSEFEGMRKWYAFEAGGVQFISLDSQTFFGDPGRLEQLDWLGERLADSRFKHTIVFFHVPPYTSGKYRDEAPAVRQLADILEGAGVPVVFAGHDHAYERLVAGPTTYFVTGGGSAAIYDKDETDPHSEFYDSQSHFLEVEVTSDTIDVRAVAAYGDIFDEASIPWSPEE